MEEDHFEGSGTSQVKNDKGLNLGSDRGQERITDVKAEFTAAKDCLYFGGVLNATSEARGSGYPGRQKVNSKAQTSKGRVRLKSEWKWSLSKAVKP